MKDAQEFGLERLVFFSDAVIAIAITLLAVDLQIPDIHASSAELHAALVDMGPRFASFVISSPPGETSPIPTNSAAAP